MAKKAINKIFLFPFSLIVIFFSSLIIIFSPVGNKNIIKVTKPPVEWKTYINNQHGFEFQYPSNLQNIEKYSQNEYYITSFTSSDIKYTKSPLDTDIVSIGTEYSIFFDNKKCNVWSNGFGIYGYGIFHKNTVDSFPANVSYQGPSNNTYRLNIDTDLGCVSLIGEYGENTIDKSKIEFDQILSTLKFTK